MAALKRREILAMLAAIGAGGPALAWRAAGPVQERLPWSKFRKTGDFPKLVNAVRAMKANGNAASPDSWLFWANIHQSHCPHGKDYFLAWHRGYLSLFERQLRKAGKSETLRLPYWDYFADANVPEELTRGNAATNPLFETRKGTQVDKALVYAAFGKDITAFERGVVKNCFEAGVEAFHNNVHNLIGGRMATMQSPQDIVFWMHHANIDRLWAAWTLAGQGRQMPAADMPYWGGQLEYETGMSVRRADAISTETLGYRYADLRMPDVNAVRTVEVTANGGAAVKLPTVTAGEREDRDAKAAPPRPMVGAPPPAAAAAPPPAAAPAPAAAAPIPFRGIWLGRETRSIRMPLRRTADMRGMPSHHHDASDELQVVLDAVTLTQAGEGGGYFYKLYLDLDDLDYDQIPGEDRLLGTVGPFQIAAALTHAEDGRARIELPAADIVRKLAGDRDPEELGVTFVRVDAGTAPGGSVISIERVEFRGRLG
ncbi:MAG: tyrosinase family protein [Sphingomonas sp.]|uniref:tyrosinase family protein n=1 Tax=Sphingomonas sp. TaxID=28214 RepID=UPI0025E47BCC|nr:tyrosinase family protein [Sphingomonas sp.]MBX3565056.1 tyrosinase family protein [Sphingomonas sp.]